MQHQLRESFRKFFFDRHHSSKRRDAFRVETYHGDKCQWARKMADESFQNFQVLVGGCVSPACYQIMTKRSICELCESCNKPVDLLHAWVCPKYQEIRNECNVSVVPKATSSKRTGWPEKLDDLLKSVKMHLGILLRYVLFGWLKDTAKDTKVTHQGVLQN